MLVMLSMVWGCGRVGSVMNILLGPFIDVLGVPFFVVIMILSSITVLYVARPEITIDYEKMQEERAGGLFRRSSGGPEPGTRSGSSSGEARADDADRIECQQQFTLMAIILTDGAVFFWLLFRLPRAGAEMTMTVANGIVMPFIGAVSL